MRIRRAGSGDFPAIHFLLNQLMPGAEPRRQIMWSALMTLTTYGAWVAEVDDTLAGFVDLFVVPDVAHGEHIGIISNLVVDQRYRGQALGERLLRQAIEYSRLQRAVEVHVWTDVDNARAIGLYEKLGFAKRAVLLELETRA